MVILCGSLGILFYVKRLNSNESLYLVSISPKIDQVQNRSMVKLPNPLRYDTGRVEGSPDLGQ